MKQTTKYEIVRGYDTREVAREVNRFLKEGWSLYGPLLAAPDGDKVEPAVLFAQALIKEGCL